MASISSAGGAFLLRLASGEEFHPRFVVGNAKRPFAKPEQPDRFDDREF